jgi:hypothetical protein
MKLLKTTYCLKCNQICKEKDFATVSYADLIEEKELTSIPEIFSPPRIDKKQLIMKRSNHMRSKSYQLS